ncbi:unnamed protein product [Scytosiphon promiscuus]
MGDAVKLSISKEYSAYPAGRDEADGPYNGEKFRKNLLLPYYNRALENNSSLVVSLDGVMSFGSSFLEEAFGGLIRKEKVEKKDLKKRLEIVIGRPGNVRYKAAIIRYIDQA